MVLGLSGSAGSLAGEKKSGVFLMTSWPDLFQVARNQEPLFFSRNNHHCRNLFLVSSFISLLNERKQEKK
jgi:hypothetical protein